MAKLLKNIKHQIISKVNLDIKRTLNNRKIRVPVINGIKVGVSSEKWMSGLLKEIFECSGCDVFYDVGINLGQTLIKVRTINDNIKYVGFEPNPSCVFYVQRLVTKNNWKNITIIPVGLSDKDCLLQLFGSNDTDPESTLVRELRPTEYTSKLVPVFRFESIKKNFYDEKVAVLKIDVEGSELEVINSLSLLIEKDRPIIIMEVLPNIDGNDNKVQRNNKMVTTLGKLEYSFFRIIKTSLDTYTGIMRVEDIGNYTDPVLKDHVILPNEKVNAFEKDLTIVK